jgi:hypothetical protein
VRPPGFSPRRRHGKLLVERIQVRILGHIGRILGSYLHDLFQSWHSGFVAMTQPKNFIELLCKPCLAVEICKIFELFFLPIIANNSRWE